METRLGLVITTALVEVSIAAELTDFVPVTPANINLQWSPTIQQLERTLRQIENKFVHKEKHDGLLDLVDACVGLAARLVILARLRDEEIEGDKIKYAPHPSFTKLSD